MLLWLYERWSNQRIKVCLKSVEHLHHCWTQVDLWGKLSQQELFNDSDLRRILCLFVCFVNNNLLLLLLLCFCYTVINVFLFPVREREIIMLIIIVLCHMFTLHLYAIPSLDNVIFQIKSNFIVICNCIFFLQFVFNILLFLFYNLLLYFKHSLFA